MLTIATFNLCNLGADAPPARLERTAHIIANDLAGPDILALQEVKAANNPVEPYGGRVPAPETYRALIQSIMHAGGPKYDFREIPPLADRDGGQLGFNIRVGFLFNPRRLEFDDRGMAGPEDAAGIRFVNCHAELTLNPSRIAPRELAFEGHGKRCWAPSRKALVGEFSYRGERVFVVACHLKSQRAFTRRAGLHAKKQRHAQAKVIHRFVANLLTCCPDAHVVVLGDMNDVTDSTTLRLLKGGMLSNLLEGLPRERRYTRRHGFQRQTLDHILVSPSLREAATVRVLHVNSDDPNPLRASDHDPVLAALNVRTDHGLRSAVNQPINRLASNDDGPQMLFEE